MIVENNTFIMNATEYNSLRLNANSGLWIQIKFIWEKVLELLPAWAFQPWALGILYFLLYEFIKDMILSNWKTETKLRDLRKERRTRRLKKILEGTNNCNYQPLQTTGEPDQEAQPQV